jgi:methyltransferase (TIGR00027 family)
MKPTYNRTIEKSCGFQFARWSAGAKAFEDLLPENQRVIHDPLARYYAGAPGMRMVKMMHLINPNIRKAIALRARYFDDHSRTCIQDGYDQIVLLGAGYDSRYVRLPEFRNATIFELDLNSTQVIKKALTRRLYGKLPANVKYVAIDFSQDSVTEKLLGAGFQAHRKTLFIWEGVTLFLNQDIIEHTLGQLAELATESRIVFDFVPPELIDDQTDYQGNRQLLKLCADIQEPLTFGFQPERMPGVLRRLGYDQVKIIGLQQANKIYCGSDRIEDSYYFATARIGGNDQNGHGRNDAGQKDNGLTIIGQRENGQKTCGRNVHGRPDGVPNNGLIVRPQGLTGAGGINDASPLRGQS